MLPDGQPGGQKGWVREEQTLPLELHRWAEEGLAHGRTA